MGRLGGRILIIRQSFKHILYLKKYKFPYNFYGLSTVYHGNEIKYLVLTKGKRQNGANNCIRYNCSFYIVLKTFYNRSWHLLASLQLAQLTHCKMFILNSIEDLLESTLASVAKHTLDWPQKYIIEWICIDPVNVKHYFNIQFFLLDRKAHTSIQK